MFAHSTASDPLVFGWYFVPAVTAPVPLSESLIELRDVHSVPRVVLDQLIKGGKRVASLVSPYREHLAQHFAVTYMRVALPEPYATQP
jgi:predicted ATP-grasp superfamily ATP-dependent carboligase